MRSEYKGSKVGFPIRRSLDQSSFAAPQSISQRTTSFIASQRQGIHQMLLRHLITLMIDVRSAKTGHDLKKDLLSIQRSKASFACQAYSTLTAAGRGWCAELGCPLVEYAASLRFQTSAPHTQQGRARTSFDIPEQPSPSKNGGACRDRTDDLKLAKLPLSQLS